MASEPIERPGGEVRGLGGKPAAPATTSAGGAAIRDFRWVDHDDDRIGGPGAEPKPDGTKDQHLRLELEMPPNTIIQLIAITGSPAVRWGTQPGEPHGPIGLFRRGRPVARSYVAQVGLFSGTEAFDVYLNTEPGLEPGATFEVVVVLAIGGDRVTLNARCPSPGEAPAAIADARPRRAPAPSSPSTERRPAVRPSEPAPTPRPEAPPTPAPAPKPEFVPAEVLASEIPEFVTPTSGGASILAFDWADRNDDYAGTEGRTIAPGGGKDEHFRLSMELPAAAIIEEIAIVGGPVRWTTRPTPRTWPVAVVARQEPRNRRQSMRLGAFSGRWAFDLYVESHPGIRPGQAFGAEVVVIVQGTRHRLTARCQRK